MEAKGMSTKKNGKAAVTVDSEFMPGQTQPEAETIQKFARSILDDPDYRDSLRQRAKSGRLTPAESNLLITMGMTGEPTKKPGKSYMQWAMEIARPEEIRVIADVARRAIAAAQKASL